MENLVDSCLFGGVYKDRKVLVTGHTGFKGSWLCLWLQQMGAEVCGYSLPSPTTPSHFKELNLGIKSVIADIRDQNSLDKVFGEFEPEIVFHLAAQPLVRLSYENPDETFETNVMGSLRVYEAIRKTKSVRALITITTDKVYHNDESGRAYQEDDRLGGKDPYSASKAAMEILTSSYIHSYFSMSEYKKSHNVLVSPVRAGNVIGGGDWAKDRLIPDIVKASINNKPVILRSPNSTRPWQHVLESLSGYLLLGSRLLEEDSDVCGAYNFGPSKDEDITVEEVVKCLKKHWHKIEYKIEIPDVVYHEAALLKLDSTKASKNLNWSPVWNSYDALKYTILWYKSYYEENSLTSLESLYKYVSDAKDKASAWI